MNLDNNLSGIIIDVYKLVEEKKHEYITPEHVLLVALERKNFKEIIEKCNGNVDTLKSNLSNYIEENINVLEEGKGTESFAFNQVLMSAARQCEFSGNNVISLEHIISAIFDLEESFGRYYLEEQGINKGEILYYLCHEEKFQENEEESFIQKYAVNLTNEIKENGTDPLIGRKDVLERTLQILCRRNKNNPIHVGEPGVGKTAIIYGLAKMIVEGKVPKKLKKSTIFTIDLGGILAGTKYRGDFEERMKGLLKEIKKEKNPIVYIDEIHTLVGAGGINGGAMDASNLIKPYLVDDSIRFIGATTYEEYKKHFEKDKALTRRFQIVEIKEPTEKEAIEILMGLKESYENYHKVKYTDKAIEKAVKLSSKYINNKFLPDKAIDVMDEAGAFISSKENKNNIIDQTVIESIMAKITMIPKDKVEGNEIELLRKLKDKLGKTIFGQKEALENIDKCIKMSKAGFNDDSKPIASMLFVGPTGVGKTEVAKTLAKELNIDFVRFDMSEYGEKHAASKLIGAPPGYVGYEEGGLLTDTIKKKPHAVLLLDEIEKAHGDILNVLLQVMDYANLTDNQGRKTDFRNIILIMTSNAGAKNIGKGLIGFGDRKIQGEAINDEVKKVFSPEFRNRLDKIIVFNHIDDEMAKNIIDKELRLFKEKLMVKNINIEFSTACIEAIRKKAISQEYGAREIIRTINSEIKPILVEEVLFGKLSNGGKGNVDYQNDEFVVIDCK